MMFSWLENQMKDQIGTFVLLSLVYIISCCLTMGLVMPLQKMLFGSLSINIGVLFLPHGIRILAFYYHGWRAIFYLLPASYLMVILSNQIGTSLHWSTPIAGLLSCYAGFYVASFIIGSQNRFPSVRSWKFLVFAGFLSSLCNGLVLSSIQYDDVFITSVVGYIFGDMLGLITCLLLLMYGFRLFANFNKQLS
jgi:hypothetical protein